MAFIDNMSITDFKGHVHEEARRLNLAGFGSGLGNDPDTVQANMARQYGPGPRLFPPKKPTMTCWHCGFHNPTGEECHKRIAEEYLAKQAKRQQQPKGKGKGRGGGKQQKPQQSGNVAKANEATPAYSAIFGGLGYCCKAAVNHKIRRVNGVWIKDCGAIHHMHHDKTIFSDYHPLKHRLYVGGIGSGLMAVGVGNVQITDPTNNKRILKKVLHVPKLKNGLMSLNQLALEGWTSTITKDGCIVAHGEFRIHSPIKNGLCVWDQNEEVSETTEFIALLAESSRNRVSLTDWHERLGHVSKDTLVKLGESAIEDLDLDLDHHDHSKDSTIQQPCKGCMHGKQPRQSFHSLGKRRDKPLELIHSDLSESHVISLGGGKYVLTFVDDCTRHCRAYILSNKSPSTVLKAFKEYQAWAERQSGHKIKELRTDRGTEYMGEMIDYVKSKGMEHNPTAAHSSQSNGVAERMNRTLFDMACPMLDAAGAPLELWAEAILTACHIRNRLPSRSLDSKTPHEM